MGRNKAKFGPLDEFGSTRTVGTSSPTTPTTPTTTTSLGKRGGMRLKAPPDAAVRLVTGDPLLDSPARAQLLQLAAATPPLAALPPDILDAVFASCSGNLNATIAALRDMTMTSEKVGDEMTATPLVPTMTPSPLPSSPQPPPTSTVDLWSLLPNDVQNLILQQLSSTELARLAPLSRAFADLVRSRRRNTLILSLPPRLVTDRLDALPDVLAAHPAVTTVSLTKAARMLRGDVVASFAHALAFADELRSSLSTTTISTKIESIDLRSSATWTDDDVQTLCLALPHLRSVRFEDCALLTDRTATMLSSYKCRGTNGGLASIRLGNCRLVTDKTLSTLLRPDAACLSSLTHLDLAHTSIRGPGLASIPTSSVLQSLRLSYCRHLHHVTLQLAPSIPLVELHLVGCARLERITLVASSLQRLNVTDCPQLAWIEMRCPRLQTLLAASCPRLESLCGHVEPSVLAAALEDDPSTIPPTLAFALSLEQVNLRGARSMRMPMLRLVLRLARRLVTLIIEGMVGLEGRLELRECSALTDCIVSGCRELNSIDAVACERLSILRAVRCDMLTQLVATRAREWTEVDVRNCAALMDVQIAPSMRNFVIKCDGANAAAIDVLRRMRGKRKE